MRFLILSALVGCATIHQTSGEESPVVNYIGTAHGAAILAKAQDQRPYDLAQSAMDKGQPVSLTRTDDLVQFNASYGWGVYPATGGYAPADVISTQDGWYAPTGLSGSLPTLGTTVVTSVHTDASDGIVPCPTDHKRRTVAEQAACAEDAAGIALMRTKGK